MLKIGIVGLPNVGKSTLFKALTKKTVDASNYPFCTIDPNVGCVQVPDQRLSKLAEISNSAQIIHTAIEFVDIAGLVKGAHEGEGLGNKFLANIREVDAIAQVVRGFINNDIIHVHGKVNPKEDIEIINTELILADLETINKRLERLQKQLKGGGEKLLKKQNEVLIFIKEGLESGSLVNKLGLDQEQKELIKELNLLTNKPFIYIYNIDEDKVGKNCELDGIDQENIVPICAKIESELSELDNNEAKEFMNELGMDKSGLDRVIQSSYKLLNLITFLTTGEKETRAWTVEKNSKAPKAAAVIHSDFEHSFIRAEVIKYEDFIKYGGEMGAKDNGALRIEGKDYIVQDGDVVHFRVGN